MRVAAKRGGLIAALLAMVLLAVCLTVPPVAVSASAADEQTGTAIGTVTTADEPGTGLTLQAINKTTTYTSQGRSFLTIDLTEQDDQYIQLPGEHKDRYLAIWITGKANPVQSAMPANWFYMEGVTASGGLTHVHTTASYRVTAPAFYKDGDEWKPTTIERGGCSGGNTNNNSGRTMFRVTNQAALVPAESGLAKGANLPKSVVFLPFSTMRAGTNLQKMRYLTISQEIAPNSTNGAPNDARFNEYEKISVVTLPGYKVNGNTNDSNNVDGTQGKFNGFISADAADYDAPLADPADVLTAMQETVLVDFTQYTQADVDEALVSGKFRTHLHTNNRTAKDWFGPTPPADNNGPFATVENNAEYAKYVRLDAGKKVSAQLNASLDGALRLGYDKNATLVGDTAPGQPSHSVMSYLQIWEGEPVDVSNSSGFAVKLRGLANNTVVRLHFYDKDGSVYIAGNTPNDRNRGVNWPFVTDDGEEKTLLEYNKSILLNAGDEGTLYMRYDVLTPYDNENNRKTFNGPLSGEGAVSLTKSRISSIAKVVVSFNASMNNSAVVKARLDIGSLATVNAATGELTEIFNTADYTYADDETDTQTDVNLFAPTAGKMVAPINKNQTGEPEDFKNEAWLFAKASKKQLTVTTEGGGTTGGHGSGEYDSLTYISLVAVPMGDTVFTGWYDTAGTLLSTDETYTALLRDDLALTAKFEEKYYDITFVDGEEPIDTARVERTETSFTLASLEIAAPEKQGYTFVGWKVNGELVSDSQEIPITGDMTIAAAWEVCRYTITFDSNGGTAVDPITQDYNTDVTAPAAPTRDGYTFAGWQCNGEPYTFGKLTESITLVAAWTANEYTITFVNDDDTVLAAITVQYGETPIYAGQAPTKAATDTHTYEFAGWDKPLAAVTGDATYKATYTAIEIENEPPKEKEKCGAMLTSSSVLVAFLLLALGGALLVRRRKGGLHE